MWWSHNNNGWTSRQRRQNIRRRIFVLLSGVESLPWHSRVNNISPFTDSLGKGGSITALFDNRQSNSWKYFKPNKFFSYLWLKDKFQPTSTVTRPRSRFISSLFPRYIARWMGKGITSLQTVLFQWLKCKGFDTKVHFVWLIQRNFNCNTINR